MVKRKPHGIHYKLCLNRLVQFFKLKDKIKILLHTRPHKNGMRIIHKSKLNK